MVSNFRAGIDGLYELINRSGSTNTVRPVHADEKSGEIAIFLTCHPVSAKRMRRIFNSAASAACSSPSAMLTQFIILSNFQEDEAREGPNTHDRAGLLATATDNLFEDMKTTNHLLVLPVRWPAVHPTTSRHSNTSQLDHATSSSRLIVWRAGLPSRPTACDVRCVSCARRTVIMASH